MARDLRDRIVRPPCGYQWDYLRSPAKNLSFFAGYLRLAMIRQDVIRIVSDISWFLTSVFNTIQYNVK